MAERSQLQYTAIVGPVWSEPVASRMAWLPRVQQPAPFRPPNRLGDFVQPAFDALYKPAGLQWMPSDRYAGQALPFVRLGEFARPIFEALYRPEGLEWKPEDRYVGRALARGWADFAFVQVVAAPTFDPQTLDWQPRGLAPQVQVELRRIGDFQQPGFDALYDPQRLEWLPSERYYGRALERAPGDLSVYTVLVIPPPDIVPLYILIDGFHRLAYGLKV